MAAIPGKQPGDLLVGSDPAGNVAGVALGKEFDRQRHDVPEKPADHDHRELGLQPQQQRLACRSASHGTAAVTPMPISSGTSQCGVLDQDVVDEDFGKSRRHDAGHDQRETHDHQQPDRLFRAAQLPQQQPHPLRLVPSFLNASVLSMVSTTPVKARSSSAMSIRRRPIAGSLM